MNMVEVKKDKNPLVSIIVPFFNVESYIGACIESIFGQDYNNIELILIDDCGSDRSAEIVDKYIKSTPLNIDFFVLKHSFNKGLSAARNTGTKAAHGDYLIYVDSDDRLFPNAISSMVEKALRDNADMVVGDYISMKGNEVVGSTVPTNTAEGLIVGTANIIDCYCHYGFYMMAWNKLIRASIITNNKVEFIEGIIHEDNPWSMKLAFLMERVVILRNNTYIYTIRPGSIVTNSKLDLKRNSWFRGLQSYVEDINKHPQFRNNYAFHEYVVSEILLFLFFVGHNFDRRTSIGVLKKLDKMAYDCKFKSPFKKELPITHRLFNLMLLSPVWLRFLLLKLILTFK